MRPILACITPQPHCANIITAAKTMAERLNCKLFVLTALPLKEQAESRAENLKILKSISDSCDVDIIIRYSDKPEIGLSLQAKELKPLHIFIGEDNGFLNKFLAHYNEAPVSVVSKNVVFTVPQTKGA